MPAQDVATRFEEIYHSTYKKVLTYITAKCRHTADIADIFQDTYMELYQVICKRGLDYVANDEAFALWLAKKKLARYYSLRVRLQMLVSFKGAEDETDLSDFEADAFATEDFAVNHALLEAARQFIQAQPEVVQKVFYLHYEVDLTIAEVAKALSMKESTVKSKLYRTLKELRKILA